MSAPEVWLRGPVSDVPAVLQPVVHGLLQCVEETAALLEGLTTAQLNARPHGVASISFHLRHAAGSIDRLCTYARGEALSDSQREALAAEKQATDADARALRAMFEVAVQRAIGQLRTTDELRVLDGRAVGRAGLPSTVMGLLFHAAEHTQRHVAQAVTTAIILRSPV